MCIYIYRDTLNICVYMYMYIYICNISVCVYIYNRKCYNCIPHIREPPNDDSLCLHRTPLPHAS